MELLEVPRTTQLAKSSKLLLLHRVSLAYPTQLLCTHTSSIQNAHTDASLAMTRSPKQWLDRQRRTM